MKKVILLFFILLIPIFSCSDTSEDYVAKALNKMESEDYQGALLDLNKSLELDPENAGTYILRGKVKRSLRNIQGAMQDFERAAELDPNESTAYLNLGHLKFSLKDYNGAIDEYSKAIETSQGDPLHYAHYYNVRAQAKIKAEDYKGASIDYKKYMQLITAQ